MRAIEHLEAAIGWQFKNPALLREALTHKSYAFENSLNLPDNQRLEFFGDAVLELISSEYLYNRYPDANEGELTKIRSAMTRGETLYELAEKLNIDDYMFLGKGESRMQGKNRQTRMIDAFEALTAALYSDAGLDFCRHFFITLFESIWDDPYEFMLRQNPKGSLQELTQSLCGKLPEYRLESVVGEDHQPLFCVAVYMGDTEWGRGEGGSRRAAEEAAARKAYEFCLALQKSRKKS